MTALALLAAVAAAAPIALEPDVVLEATNGDILNFVVGVGDVNGDGFDDVLGAPFFYPPEGLALYLGGAGGPAPAPVVVLRHDDDSGIANAWTPGQRVGDVNGDGFDDALAIGPTTAWLHFGSPTGLSEDDHVDLGSTDVAPAGDLDGDGFADLLAPAPDRGLAIRFGSPSGPGPERTFAPGASPGLRTGGGDVDGDGFDDVVFTAGGALWVAPGRRRGLGDPRLLTRLADVYELRFAGDVDGDGRADLVARIGPETLTLVHPGPDGARLDAVEEHAVAGYAGTLAAAGDVDGDGFGELLVGARQQDTRTPSGFLFRGGPDGLLPEDPVQIGVPSLNGEISQTGVTGDVDLDGDCLADVVLGSQVHLGRLAEGAAPDCPDDARLPRRSGCASGAPAPGAPRWLVLAAVAVASRRRGVSRR